MKLDSEDYRVWFMKNVKWCHCLIGHTKIEWFGLKCDVSTIAGHRRGGG